MMRVTRSVGIYPKALCTRCKKLVQDLERRED